MKKTKIGCIILFLELMISIIGCKKAEPAVSSSKCYQGELITPVCGYKGAAINITNAEVGNIWIYSGKSYSHVFFVDNIPDSLKVSNENFFFTWDGNTKPTLGNSSCDSNTDLANISVISISSLSTTNCTNNK